MSSTSWIEMQAIVLEKKRFVIKVILAVDEIDSFICTNGPKTIITPANTVFLAHGFNRDLN